MQPAQSFFVGRLLLALMVKLMILGLSNIYFYYTVLKEPFLDVAVIGEHFFMKLALREVNLTTQVKIECHNDHKGSSRSILLLNISGFSEDKNHLMSCLRSLHSFILQKSFRKSVEKVE